MTRLAIPAAVAREVAASSGLPRAALTARWRAHYKADPPKGISRVLLTRAVAHAMQVKATRGLRPAAKRKLLGDEDVSAITNSAVARRPALRPGSRLIREWNGKTHTVEVAEDGFLWNNDRYRSLSAVARAITGARWSGPRFFGTGGKK